MATFDVLRSRDSSASRDPAASRSREALTAASLGAIREQVVEELGIHFAYGDLSTSELERRLGLAFAAVSLAALEELVADLPPLGGDLRPVPVRVLAPGEEGGRERAVLAAFMGAVVRKGGWTVPRHLKVVAVMGGAELDLRQAQFTAPVTEIEIFALMGGVEVILPPGVRVEMVGMAVAGGFDADAADPSGDFTGPLVRLSGLAVLGGVEAKARRPKTKALAKVHALVQKARKRAGKGNG